MLLEKSFRTPRLGLWVGLAICLSANDSHAAWRAGAASIDITPADPVRLSGYGSRTSEHEGVEMRLHAKALALTWDQDKPVVMLTVDNCGVPASMRTEVLGRIQKAGLAWRTHASRFIPATPTAPRRCPVFCPFCSARTCPGRSSGM